MADNQMRQTTEKIASQGTLPEGDSLKKNVAVRRLMGKVWQVLFLAAIIFGLFILLVLVTNVVSNVITVIAVQTKVPEEEVLGPYDVTEVEALERAEMLEILEASKEESGFLRGEDRRLPFAERSDDALETLIRGEVLQEEVAASWTLFEGLFNYEAIQAEAAEQYPRAELHWHSWLNWDFLSKPMNSNPGLAGVRTAILGTLFVIFITMGVAFPLGVASAVYLEEYASDTRNPVLRQINGLIQTNINNLAGVPSIIYGMLGLAIFVRALGFITSGQFFAGEDAPSQNGRTIISAGLTLALLILPIIIINSQEAIRAVPRSLRQASYGLGATKWQTTWHHVLPNAIGGILTGTILAMSRAIGETAPLIVVGASTFIVTDPDSPFAQFTVLPMLIYNWTARPSDEFRNIAAAGIIVLLAIMLSLNAVAIYLRNRYQRSI